MVNTPPVPHYDDPPLSELPRRLTGLKEEQLRALLRYEKQHHNRLAILQVVGNYIAATNTPEH